MRFDILTIFPRLLESPLEEGIIRRALTAGQITIGIHDIRSFATDRHSMTDDRPFGGGEGMVMKPEPIVAALDHVQQEAKGGHVIFLSPQGARFDHAAASRLTRLNHLILVCGRYEGIDERIRENWVHEELSIGDYVLTGGELAALVVVDAVVRLLPGVLGCADSAENDSFSRSLLKHPQYTRPRVFCGFEVPEVLLSGDHAAIAEWRFLASVRQTLLRRPDMLRQAEFSKKEWRLLVQHGLAEEVRRGQDMGAVDRMTRQEMPVRD